MLTDKLLDASFPKMRKEVYGYSDIYNDFDYDYDLDDWGVDDWFMLRSSGKKGIVEHNNLGDVVPKYSKEEKEDKLVLKKSYK